ncbi:MAG TPA: LuxR C-terminal-related transcriptional regulator [Actinophytocola sp.]|jgi:DNA-binding NarL/FixJ family response regulator|uniref:LuxR C-terminal-related transcriptional regulator n=1 Tax=Actinophytocola sp. TaxID=1872138 RepID=UPI002F93EAFF
MIRIALWSERRLFADLFTADLAARPEYAVVGAVTDVADLWTLCALREPDVAVAHFDGGLGADPERTIAQLRACLGLVRLVVLYDQLGPPDLCAIERLGVDTLVPSSRGLDALLAVLRQCGRERRGHRRTLGTRLTDVEERIIDLLAAGHTVAQIAKHLKVSESRVANAKHRIYRKLGVDSQAQAVARAVALGIVNRPHPQPRALRRAVALWDADDIRVELRGADDDARSRVAAVLRAASIQVRAGAPLLLLVDPIGTDWPDDATGEAVRPIVLVLSAAPRRAEVLEALLRGAVAVVLVDEVASDLVAALWLSAHGFVALDGGAGGALLESLRVTAAPTVRPLVLTSRESDILRSIADGHTVRRTAQVLGIAEKTVENTQARLFRKLGARNRPGALAAAHALGLMPDRSGAIP